MPLSMTAVSKDDTSTGSGVMAADSTAVATDKEEEQTPSDEMPYRQNKKQPAPPPPVANPDWDKKIIKTADLNVEVKSFRTFADRLRQNVKRLRWIHRTGTTDAVAFDH